MNWFPNIRSVNEGVYVPLAPIADWLLKCARYIAYEESSRAFPTDENLITALQRWKTAAPAVNFDEDSWDDRRYEWSERHFLLAGADGSWLPNLAFVRSDENLWISAGPARFASPDAPDFLVQTGTFSVPWQDAKQVLAEFVDYVGEILREARLDEAFPWSREAGAFERALEISLLEHLALELNLSPMEVASLFDVSSEADLFEKLQLPKGATAKDSVAVQAIRDLDLGAGVIGAIVECDCATRARRHGRFRERRLRAMEAAPGRRSEIEGYEAAVLIRRDLGMNGGPLSDPESFLQKYFDIEVDELSSFQSTHNHAIAGGHLDGFGKIILFQSSQVQKPWSRKMEIFRGVGHLLLDGEPQNWAVGAGSSNRAIGPRRRRSGAFAAEMLLPQSAIRERSGGVLDIAAKPEVFESLMADYGVGAQTAAWQCWNADLLSSREIVDELIETYGAGASNSGSGSQPTPSL